MSESFPTPSDAELTRYLAGDVSPAHAQAIQRWLDAAPEHRQRLDDLRLVLDATASPRIQWDAEASWQRLAARLEPARRPEVVRLDPAATETRRRFAPAARSSRWIGRALIAAGLGAIAVAGWQLRREPVEPQHVATQVIERETRRGERVSFRLADGTGVMLGPASRLRYSAAYGQGARVVELEGDGYFEVLHDEARPFVVRTRTALIRDLGTRFVVRARPTDRAVKVAVAEGVVALARSAAGAEARAASTTPAEQGAARDSITAHRALAADSVVLTPGDVARLADTGTAGVRRGVNVQRYLGWTEGRLVFERAPLPRVVEELQRWYDVDIQLADRKLDARILTATFRDKPITEVLDLVAASLDLQVSRSGQRFVLSAR